MSYDSTIDTLEHIRTVAKYLGNICEGLCMRAERHDQSKLESPEKEIFDRVTPKLKGLTYGSPEYKASLEEMGVALKHHYEKNSHHPEHHPDGLKGMDLLDLVEMFCDWCAATERHNDGDIHRSIDQNRERFGYDDVLASIFHNTARRRGTGANAEG